MHARNDGEATAGNLQALIHQLRRKGVTLWMQDSRLRYRAPRGVLTAEERRALSGADAQIVSLLDCHARSPYPGESTHRSAGARRAPLSFTQLEHLTYRQRYGGRPIRHIASVFRLQGPLRVELLRDCILVVERRHDALRTRIVRGDGNSPVQEIADRYCADLEVIPLWAVPAPRIEARIEQEIQRAILDATDYAASPLFKAVVLAVGTEEHLLVLALDHMISDLASLHLLSGEIFTAYAQMHEGLPIDLPSVAVQLPDHASRLRARSLAMLTRAQRRLGHLGRTRFPDDVLGRMSERQAEFGSVRFVINRESADELRTWARRHGTTVVIATLTAYAALVLRWCGVMETVIRFTTDGRTSSALEHTVGYLAFNVYIRAAIEERSTFLDLLRLVIEEYCRSRDEADFGYAAAQTPPGAFTCNTAVNWLPGGCGISGTLVPGTELSLFRSPLAFANMPLELASECDHEPLVGIAEQDGCIVGQIAYTRRHVSDHSMERFATNMRSFMEVMVRTPTRPVRGVELQ